MAQGGTANLTSQITTTVGAAQPVGTITLGESTNTTAQTTTTTDVTETEASESAAVLTDIETGETSSGSADTAVERGGLSDLLNASDSADASESATLDLVVAEQNTTETPVVTTTTPVITGMAAPNVEVTIEVHSDTNIQTKLTTDANGQFVLDIAAMSQQLEPGEHTVTYSYVDPNTGQTVTKTQTFTVAPKSSTGNQIAAVTASPSPTPYGSGNPYPVGGATSSGQTSTTSGKTSTSSGRVSVPSTSSGIPVSGSAGTTLALVVGGLFFLLAGGWSYWIAQQLGEDVA